MMCQAYPIHVFGGSGTVDLLDEENRSRFATLRVLSLRLVHNRGRVADALFWSRHLLLWLLGELHVEEPLVDLDARKASFDHSLFAHLAIPLAA